MKREIYPNDPIVFMAVEVRHSLCEPLERKQVAQLSTQITGLLPLPGEMNEAEIIVQSGPDGQSVKQEVVTPIRRWTSRDKRTALTMRPDSLAIETTDYGSYERVRELLDVALRARLSTEPPAGVERIGLRYIDEIRLPLKHGDDAPAWQEWVDPALLGPVHIGSDLGLVPAVSEGTLVFARDSSSALVLRFGTQDDHVVQSTPELRRPLPPPGPLFKLDIDSFWQADDEIPEFDPTVILDRTDDLHEPVRGVFESLVTERLRKEVLRHG